MTNNCEALKTPKSNHLVSSRRARSAAGMVSRPRNDHGVRRYARTQVVVPGRRHRHGTSKELNVPRFHQARRGPEGLDLPSRIHDECGPGHRHRDDPRAKAGPEHPGETTVCQPSDPVAPGPGLSLPGSCSDPDHAHGKRRHNGCGRQLGQAGETEGHARQSTQCHRRALLSGKPKCATKSHKTDQ